ncbi:MAG: hypothetical protein Kapaf2KO_18290 [Candidatus Kapaibacteriales bacterium]
MIGSGIVLLLIGVFTSIFILSFLILLLGLVLTLFALWFFRDPERKLALKAENNINVVVSPADGKVVEIIEENEPHYRDDKSIRISVFLSPLDVHVNRYPVSGVVEYSEYIPGKYLVAYHPKSSELNEHSRVGVKTGRHKVFFKQIVGVLARRIVFNSKVGENIKAGQQYGMMKFGSRMDVALPLGSDIKVTKGQKVKGAETILAVMPE